MDSVAYCFSCFSDYLCHYNNSYQNEVSFTFYDITMWPSLDNFQSNDNNCKLFTDHHSKAYAEHCINVADSADLVALNLAIGRNKWLDFKNSLQDTQVASYWLLEDLKRYADNTSWDDCDTFVNLGFTSECSKDYLYFFKLRTPLFDTQTPLYWLIDYLNELFESYSSGSSYVQEFIKADGDPTDVTAAISSFAFTNTIYGLRCGNDDIVIALERLTNFLRGKVESIADYLIYYHTTNFDGALSILGDGINLSRGAKNQDFSSEDGFYLHPEEDADKAIEWRNWGCQQAIIVFLVKKDEMMQFEHLDLPDTHENWQNEIKLFRTATQHWNGRRRFNQAQCIMDLSNAYREFRQCKYKWIQGYACRNPNKVKSFEENPSPGAEPFRQLALKSNEVVTLFHESIIGVLYVE